MLRIIVWGFAIFAFSYISWFIVRIVRDLSKSGAQLYRNRRQRSQDQAVLDQELKKYQE